MLGITTTLYLLLQVATIASTATTWPSTYDELEDIMLLNQGYKARQLSLPVTPCNFQRAPGFIPAAGFLRTAFHDVAPHNAATGQGGLDASIAFELTGPAGKDNAGPFVNNTLTFLSRFYSTQASMSDLLSLAVYTAVRGCGGPSIAVRTGRQDAQAAGALGVPKVEGTQQDFKRDFTRMGFTTQEMVKLVACGHTLGGVHSTQFPQIVASGTQSNNVQNFDRSPAVYDNAVAVDFVRNSSVNPLVVGPSRTDSDTKVFTADGGITIRQLTDAQTYQDSCRAILQKMIETVPSSTILTAPIVVYDVKPGALQLEVASDGQNLIFSGEIRVRTTELPQSSIGSVSIVYKTLADGKGSSISTNVVGTAAGYDESFTFYSFSASLDASASISSFDVLIVSNDGSAKTFDNNGRGYPVQDQIFLQHSKCSLGTVDASSTLPVKIVVAAKGQASGLKLIANTQTPRSIPFPLLSSNDVALEKTGSIGGYTLYSGEFAITPDQLNSTTLDITGSIDGKLIESLFHKIATFGLPPAASDDGSTDTPPSSSPTSGPVNSDNHPYAPIRPCGTDAGCDAAAWATETTWVIPTGGPFAHTKPAGTTSSYTTGIPSSSGGAATITTQQKTTPTGANNNKPTPPAPVVSVAEFTGDATIMRRRTVILPALLSVLAVIAAATVL